MELTIEELNKRIKFWSRQLVNSRDNVECAVLQDKITEARKKITELKSALGEYKVNQNIDAPSVADKVEPVTLSRGQIMDSGDVFRIFV